ncbi:hypothetical protein AAH979_14060 [Plantactinospora sp. ZYX-F-223]|uniref:hypothetical protein n=1 Tax=Plantactinospora sp. ZYX-F-223 TaxID=3144103 RepID=UPI0031FDCB56
MPVIRNPYARAIGNRTPVGISTAAGAGLVVGAALLAAALFPVSEPPGRLLVVAVPRNSSALLTDLPPLLPSWGPPR